MLFWCRKFDNAIHHRHHHHHHRHHGHHRHHHRHHRHHRHHHRHHRHHRQHDHLYFILKIQCIMNILEYIIQISPMQHIYYT